jgi:hypothetical protein
VRVLHRNWAAPVLLPGRRPTALASQPTPRPRPREGLWRARRAYPTAYPDGRAARSVRRGSYSLFRPSTPSAREQPGARSNARGRRVLPRDCGAASSLARGEGGRSLDYSCLLPGWPDHDGYAFRLLMWPDARRRLELRLETPPWLGTHDILVQNVTIHDVRKQKACPDHPDGIQIWGANHVTTGSQLVGRPWHCASDPFWASVP